MCQHDRTLLIRRVAGLLMLAAILCVSTAVLRPFYRPHLPETVASIGDCTIDRRLQLVTRLPKHCPSSIALPILVSYLDDRSLDLQDAAIVSLASLGPDYVEPILDRVDPEREVRSVNLLKAIAEIGDLPPNRVDDVFQLASRDGVPLAVRTEAMATLGAIGVDSVAMRLIATADDGDTDMSLRAAALEAAARTWVATRSRRVLSALLRYAVSGGELGEVGFRVVTHIGSPVYPLVVDRYRKRPPAMERAMLLHIISTIGIPDADVMRLVKDGLEDASDSVRYRAAVAGGALGPSNEQLREALGRLLSDAVPSVRVAAASSQCRLSDGDQSSIRALAEVMKGCPAVDRAYAIRALGRHTEKALPALGDLITALHDADETVRMCAATAIGDIGPRAIEAVSELEGLRADPSKDVRYAATNAVARIKRQASQ